MKFIPLPKLPWLKLYVLATAFLFLLRVIIFANVSGVEHDSGWFLGVARNLAERGIYASFNNTVITENTGASPSIHGRYSVQDNKGYTYFPAAISVGPGYVIPEAILLKIFNDGWWQYRLWPLLAYGLLLIILFFLIASIGGLFSLIILQTWLWFYPQLTVNFAFEAYGEHIALLYLFVGFWLFSKATRGKNNPLLILAAGVFISFSILTKNLFALAIPVFIPIAIKELIDNRRHLAKWFRRWSLFTAGLVLPILAFEAFRYLSVITKFGQIGYEAVNQDREMHWQMNGSGLDSLWTKNFDFALAYKKLLIWSDLGIKNIFWPWLFFLVSPIAILPFIEKGKRVLIFLLYGSAVISFGWFIFVSPNGWGRYAFEELIVALMLFSLMMGLLLRAKKFFWPTKIGFLLVAILLFIPSLTSAGTNFNFILTRYDINHLGWWSTPPFRGIQGFPHVPVLSLKDQQKVIDYFGENIKSQDRIYYEGWYLVAEIPPLVDKVFYPLARYHPDNKNQNGQSYLIYGPYQKGEFRLVGDDYLTSNIKANCQEVVFENPSYTLCLLK